MAPDLASDLYAGTSGTGLLAVQHQHLVMCLLTAEQAAGPDWRAWCTSGADGDLLWFLAAGGSHTLTAPMLEWYLATADAWRDDAPFDWYEHVLDSATALSGVPIEAWDEDVDPDAWAAEVRAAVAAAGTAYVFDGRPLAPDHLAGLAVDAAARRVAQGRPGRPAYLEQLGTWTGLLPPSWPEGTAPTREHLGAVERYAEQVAALPWRAGSKYFHGHDVDGGPGLHGV
ncbi:hypothetical protein RDV89_04825 [Nocardioides zeae]|uniref:DUF4303 domain-containing protein n=1 Tax=Nocardioides imazamoxiresistens TaxID=3231893 RepID=A0ABU3PU40_9ACTN|nr:hypothetical protein [Nocardioides zeae]MDT9592377.1 hypothetical protein [Nocardioides zeae]